MTEELEKYIFKGNLKIKINKSDLKRKTGISYTTLCKILNCDIPANKPYAFIINYYLSGSTDINNYFEIVH